MQSKVENFKLKILSEYYTLFLVYLKNFFIEKINLEIFLYLTDDKFEEIHLQKREIDRK